MTELPSKAVLTVVLSRADIEAQRGHIVRGALFVGEPVPPPEPFAEIVLRVEVPSGDSIELDAQVLQILSGRGIALSFTNLAKAKEELAALFAKGAAAAEDRARRVSWGRGEPEPAADTRDETAKLRDEIATMSANQKMQLALHGDRLARLILMKDPNKNVQSFILQNARITLEEVKYLAGFRQANPDALHTIAGNRDWIANAAILAALIRNPKTPGPTAVKLLDKVPMSEIRRLAKSNDTPQAVLAAARKRVADAGA